ncbi:MAG: anti-sigma factor domain-containing protein [Candidatus Limnocylindria bacterium]
MTEHVLDELEAYALGALDHASAEKVAAHLGVCHECRAEAASLADVVGALPDSVILREPRAALRERVLAAAKAGTRTAVRTERAWSFGRVRVWRVAVAILASIVIVLTAADVAAYRQLTALTAERDSYSLVVQSFRQGGRVWYMAGKDQFAGSGATLVDPRAEGKQPFVLFHDLPPIAAGKVLTVWLVSAESTWARAATFVPDGRDVQAVPINTDVAGFDRCAITLDDSPWGKPGTIVMESRIAPPATTP